MIPQSFLESVRMRVPEYTGTDEELLELATTIKKHVDNYIVNFNSNTTQEARADELSNLVDLTDVSNDLRELISEQIVLVLFRNISRQLTLKHLQSINVIQNEPDDNPTHDLSLEITRLLVQVRLGWVPPRMQIRARPKGMLSTHDPLYNWLTRKERRMNLKYIRHDDYGIVLFGKHIDHAKMARQLGSMDKIKSAGFAHINDDRDLTVCEGKSVSLNLESVPDVDTAMLRRMTFGY